nr:unnamed protein product [Haemonchus contortus]
MLALFGCVTVWAKPAAKADPKEEDPHKIPVWLNEVTQRIMGRSFEDLMKLSAKDRKDFEKQQDEKIPHFVRTFRFSDDAPVRKLLHEFTSSIEIAANGKVKEAVVSIAHAFDKLPKDDREKFRKLFNIRVDEKEVLKAKVDKKKDLKTKS